MQSLTHPIFREFKQFSGTVDCGFHTDFLGTKTDINFFGGDPAVGRNPSLPAYDEEYFEWVDILRSAAEAKGEFVFVELGAGYGRWTARAHKAAEQKQLCFRASLVEGDPIHAKWAREHMQLNGVSNYKIHESAIGSQNSTTMFVVEKFDKSFDDKPDSWYGQSMGWQRSHNGPIGRFYEGKPILNSGDGWGLIEVPVETLDTVLEPYAFVDLVDIDIQGAEANLIETGKGIFDRKVHRIHIGTHGREIEDRLRAAMTNLGWIKEWDFPCFSETDTPYGMISFLDGVQTWRNPEKRGPRK